MIRFFVSVLAVLYVLNASAESLLEQRQAAFKQLKESVADVKKAMKNNNFANADYSAGIILEKARLVTELFPADSYKGDTRAKKKIWEKADDFNARQQQLIIDAEALQKAARSSDPEKLKAAFKTLSKDCKGCHMRYRQLF